MAWKPPYVTTSELKSYLRVGDSDDDTELDLAIEAASRAIDKHCGRQFGVIATAEQRSYTPYRDRRRHRRRPRWVVPIDDLMTETDLEVEVDGTAVTGYALRPVNAEAEGRPWTELLIDADANVRLYGDDDEVDVTAIWGWTAVPDTIKQATLLQASRLHNRRTSPYGIAGSPDLGSELRLLAKVDADVAVVLEDFRREWSVA